MATADTALAPPSNVRLIARLDVKMEHLIKGIHLEGWRKVGDPHHFARDYYAAGIDEIIYMDAVASLYGRNNLTDVVRRTAEDVFIPLTAGGGVRSIEDVQALLLSGADKVAINTAATKRPQLISEVAQHFGAQCMVLSIEAKRQPHGGWEAYTDLGREHTGLDVVEWAQQGESLGAGEILLTSVDQEGTCRGFDVELIRAVASVVGIPLIASGGMGHTGHLIEAVQDGGADAIAMAHVLHFGTQTLDDIRATALESGLAVRTL